MVKILTLICVSTVVWILVASVAVLIIPSIIMVIMKHRHGNVEDWTSQWEYTRRVMGGDLVKGPYVISYPVGLAPNNQDE